MKETIKKEDPNLNKEQIVDWYMKDTLEGKVGDNVYLFCKDHNIDESHFYQFFNGFEGIENYFFSLLFGKTVDTLRNSKDYEGFKGQEKLLSFYYTFFGNMTQNRTFVMHLLRKKQIRDLEKFRLLRKDFLGFVKALDIEKIGIKNEHLNKLRDHNLAEGAWIQFMGILRFWLHDDSAGFEKTDVFIEKSTVAGFELINTKPIQSIIDLGKFLWKETRHSL